MISNNDPKNDKTSKELKQTNEPGKIEKTNTESTYPTTTKSLKRIPSFISFLNEHQVGHLAKVPKIENTQKLDKPLEERLDALPSAPIIQNQSKKRANDKTDEEFAAKFQSIKENYLKPLAKPKKRKKRQPHKESKLPSANIEIKTNTQTTTEKSEKKDPQTFREFLLANAKHLVPAKPPIENKKNPIPIPLILPSLTIIPAQPIAPPPKPEIRTFTEEELVELRSMGIQLPPKKIQEKIKNGYRDIINYQIQSPGAIAMVDFVREVKINENETIKIIQNLVITICEKNVCARNMNNHTIYKGHTEDDKHRVWIFPFTKGNYSFFPNKLWIYKNKVIFVGTMQDIPTIFLVNAENGQLDAYIQDSFIIPESVHFEMENHRLIYKLKDGRIVIENIAAINDAEKQRSVFNSRDINPNCSKGFFLTNSQFIVDIVPIDKKMDQFDLLVIDIKTSDFFSFNIKNMILNAFLCNDFLIYGTYSGFTVIDLVNKKEVMLRDESVTEKQKSILKICSPQSQIIINSLYRPKLLQTASQGSLAALAMATYYDGKDEPKLSIEVALVDFEKQCDTFLMNQPRLIMLDEQPKKEDMDEYTIGMISKDNFLTAYWLDDNEMCGKTFHELEVMKIINVYHRVLLLGTEIELNLKGAALYLMADPKLFNVEPKKSSETSLYLYCNKQGVFYITQQGNISFLDKEILKIVPSNKFIEPHADPLPCMDINICNVVLKITTDRGHTLSEKNSEQREKIVEAEIDKETIGIHHDRLNKQLTAYWRNHNGKICYKSFKEHEVIGIISHLPQPQKGSWEINHAILVYHIILQYDLVYSKLPSKSTNDLKLLSEIIATFGCESFAKYIEEGYKESTEDCLYLYKEQGGIGRVFYVLKDNKKEYLNDMNPLDEKLFNSTKCDKVLAATIRDTMLKKEHAIVSGVHRFKEKIEYPCPSSLTKCPLQLQFKGKFLIAFAASRVLNIWDVEKKALLYENYNPDNGLTKINILNYCFEDKGKLIINNGEGLFAFDYNVRHEIKDRWHENTLPRELMLKSPWGDEQDEEPLTLAFGIFSTGVSAVKPPDQEESHIWRWSPSNKK